jgi:phosphatidylinositol alpha-1,6-mannosyltransferase
VTFAYAYEFLKFRRTPVAPILRALYRRSRRVIAISRYTAESLARFGVDPGRVATVLPGAPRAREVPEAERDRMRRRLVLDGRRVILSVGRLIPRKNAVGLVEALPKVLEGAPDAVLALVGRGPEMHRVLHRAMDLGIRDAIRTPGALPDADVAALYSLCDVFALPAGVGPRGQVEGFGLVFAEAAAYGKPVVAGRSGGTEDAVVDGETGFLVEPDDTEALARHIVQLLDDEALARRMGEAGQRRVSEELNWTAFAKGVLAAAPDAPGRQGRRGA